MIRCCLVNNTKDPQFHLRDPSTPTSFFSWFSGCLGCLGWDNALWGTVSSKDMANPCLPTWITQLAPVFFFEWELWIKSTVSCFLFLVFFSSVNWSLSSADYSNYMKKKQGSNIYRVPMMCQSLCHQHTFLVYSIITVTMWGSIISCGFYMRE